MPGSPCERLCWGQSVLRLELRPQFQDFVAIFLLDEVGGIILATITRDLVALQGARDLAFETFFDLAFRGAISPVPFDMLVGLETVGIANDFLLCLDECMRSGERSGRCGKWAARRRDICLLCARC